jgi:hypothetical protein
MRGWRAFAAAAIGACAAYLALVVHAEADERRIVLTWNAPSACPDEASVRASVAQLLAGSSATVEGRADVRQAGDRWQVVVTMNGGERRLEADSCRALADATALIVAMAVDPGRVAANRSARDAGVASGSSPNAVPELVDASSDATPPAPLDAAPPPTAPPTPTPTPTPTPPATPTPTPTPATHFAIAASAIADFGTIPTPMLGPSLGLAWTPSPLRLELAAVYFPSTWVGVPTGYPGAQVQFSLLAVAVRGCYGLRLAAFDLGPCVGVEGGLLWGNPKFEPGEIANGGSSPLFALDAGLLGAWRFLPHLALVARGDALFQTNRPSFDVNLGPSVNLGYSNAPSVVVQPGIVTGRASLGLELRF